VVHGLASGCAATGNSHEWRHTVALDDSTYPERYDDCAVIEYQGVPRPNGRAWAVDRLRGYAGLARRAEANYYAPLVDALRDAEPGIVVAHNALTLPTALAGSAHESVVYAHNELPRSMTARELDRLAGPAAAIVCVSSALAEVTASRLPRRLRDRVHAVCNGVDVERFSPGDGAHTPPRVLFVGRMISEKGPDVLLRAAGQLPRGVAEVVLIGSHGFDAFATLTPYERSLRELAEQATVDVTFAPFVDREKLPDELRRASVLVVPSRWREPSALTAGEGLASGLAVVVSDVGGIPEVVGDTGIVVPPDDPGALAEALLGLLQDADRRTELGHRARARAEERDWQWAWSGLRDVLQAI
jgi:glycosyltransferase involved in cell wall biosynthesis